MTAITQRRARRGKKQKNRVLDLRGSINPEPALLLGAAAASLQAGEYLSVITDDPCSPNDFLRWSGGGDTHLLDLYHIHDGAAVAVFCKGGWNRLIDRASGGVPA